MSEGTDNQLEPREVRAEGSPIIAMVELGEASGEATPADRIEVEDADNPKFLRMRSGDFQLPQSVFLVIDGERREITQDSLPGDR